jgi:hypothetical protein
MEKTQLTVRVPRGFLEGAKRYATEHGLAQSPACFMLSFAVQSV